MKAAVLEQIGKSLAILDLVIPELQMGQVLVRILSAGICGSQLQEIDGLKGDPEHLPHLLGHEGCGIVEKIGEGVSTVKPGDKVVMHWRKGDGREAAGGIYNEFIFNGMRGSFSPPIKSGPVTTFSEYSIVSENRITTIPDDISNDLVVLLGCALSTALSIVINEAKLLPGDSVSVIGCGGLGLSLIWALKTLRSPFIIWGHDVVLKKELVESLGGEFAGAARFHPKVNLVIDTIGDEFAKTLLLLRGKYISLQANGTSAGGFDPAKDIPHYLRIATENKEWRRIVTHRIRLDQINEGIQLMRDGKAGRVLIEMRPGPLDDRIRRAEIDYAEGRALDRLY